MKRKVGRPRLDPRDKQPPKITVRLTRAQVEKLSAVAESKRLAGMSAAVRFLVDKVLA